MAEPIITPPFETYPLTETGRRHAEAIRVAFTECLQRVTLYFPEGRECSLVRTKMEEACFHAIKAASKAHHVEEVPSKPKSCDSL